ncbi:hypothetical protein NDN01_10165 [Sphingomonas sp. QA11]|nr:hypothetical protein [Sphingomonas sp. QA11]WCM29217.1 hypothetical protein NDN01_10165 [Sphingomonas sp. QA11]
MTPRLPTPIVPAPAPRRSRIRTVLVVIAALLAAPFVLVAFVASLNRSR